MKFKGVRSVLTAVTLAAIAGIVLGAAAVSASSSTRELQAQGALPTAASEVGSSIKLLAFDPAISVAVGGTVTWTNNDQLPHNVMANDDSFKSPLLLQSGESFSFTFAQPGSFAYRCTIHPGMEGLVIVE